MIDLPAVIGLLVMIYWLGSRVVQQLGTIIYRLTGSQEATIKVLAFLLLPGTFVHEVGHLLTAELMGVRTDDLSLIPEIKPDRTIKLGGVKIAQSDPVRRTLIGLAPVFWGMAVIWVSTYWVQQANHWGWYLGYGYLLFQLGLTMFSSREDLRGALIGLTLIGLIYLGLKYLNDLIRYAPYDNFKYRIIEFFAANWDYLRLGLLLCLGINLALFILLALVGKQRAKA